MIDHLINYLFYNPGLSFEELAKGLNVRPDDIRQDFLGLVEGKYLTSGHQSKLNSNGGTTSKQVYRLSPTGNELFHISEGKNTTLVLPSEKEENINGRKKIFISHSYISRNVVEKFIDYILKFRTSIIL